MRRSLRPIVAGFLLAGCIQIGAKTAVETPERFHVLDMDALQAPPGREPDRVADLPVVAVRAFRAPERVGRNVLRRDGPGLVSPLDHERWADEPFEAVTGVVRESLVRSGLCRAAVDPVDALAADVLVDGRLQEFAVDLPGDRPARALVRMRVTWSDPRIGRVLRSSVHESAEPLPGTDLNGLGPAMARAVERAFAQSLAGGVPHPARNE